MMSWRAIGLLSVIAALVSACTPQQPFQPPPPKYKRPEPSALWIGWRVADPQHPLVRVCDRNSIPKDGIGAAGCWRGGKAGMVKSTDTGFVGDTNVHDTVPGGACKFEYRDGTNALPAELVLGGRVVDKFSADAADARVMSTHIKVSFSPDGGWLAVIYVVKRTYTTGEKLDIEHVALVPVGTDPCAIEVSR
jgi:hypothetical protein